MNSQKRICLVLAVKNNLTNATSVPNFMNCIYVDGLTAVKPESVNIIC